MGKYFLVGYLPGVDKWYARQRQGYYWQDENLDVVLKEIRLCSVPVTIDRMLSASDVLKVTGACAFLGITVVDENGEVVKPTPVLDAKVVYLTSREMGKLLPEGWMIECQLNRYMPCFGENISLPARKTLEAAIADVRVYLAKRIAITSRDLAESITAEETFGQVVMDLGLASSDKRGSAAVDGVHRT